MPKSTFVLVADAVQEGSEVHLISEAVQTGFNDNTFVLVKDAGTWGLELHVLSRPCRPGELQVFGAETETALCDGHTASGIDGQALSLITMPLDELQDEERTHLRMEDPRVRQILTWYLEYLSQCGIALPFVFVYCQGDSTHLQRLRQASPFSHRDKQLIRQFCPLLRNQT